MDNWINANRDHFHETVNFFFYIFHTAILYKSYCHSIFDIFFMYLPSRSHLLPILMLILFIIATYSSFRTCGIAHIHIHINVWGCHQRRRELNFFYVKKVLIVSSFKGPWPNCIKLIICRAQCGIFFGVVLSRILLRFLIFFYFWMNFMLLLGF